jgi:hypothetical protein
MKFIFFITILCLLHFGAAAQKIDTLFHINGNILTGDFKKLEYGIVTWKMDGMGTMSVEAPKINSFHSVKRYDVLLRSGVRYYCSFDSSGINRKVNLLISDGRKLVGIEDIVRVFPIKKSFWLRTSGNFGLGGNYSKGSDLATLSFSSSVEHRRENAAFFFNWDNYYTFQADTLSSTKGDARLGWERIRRKKFSFGTNVGMSQNSELGTRLRLDISFVGIYDFVFNDWNRLYSGAGFSLQHETPYDASEPNQDLVGVISLGWKVYKLTSPKIWVDSDINFVPYLTSDGRTRTDFNINPKIGLIGNNLKIGVKYYYSHDSMPATKNARKDDWGTNLEISYTFH